ncbi:MAG: hypothetical protein JSR45_05520 [Proteobacteria bacterium]|nr:hypothetical protein [Pseudomonadota bacterium]
MRITSLTGLVVAGALAFGAVAQAAPAADKPAAPTTGSQPTSSDSKKDDDRIVCKAPQATGSRLPSARQCKTKREWDEQSLRDRAALEHNQVQPYAQH